MPWIMQGRAATPSGVARIISPRLLGISSTPTAFMVHVHCPWPVIVLLLAAGGCDSCSLLPWSPPSEHTPTADELRNDLGFALPASATQVRALDEFVGMYDVATIVTFTMPASDRAALAALIPCKLVGSRCTRRFLHTAQTFEVTTAGNEDRVTIWSEVYDDCQVDCGR